MIPKICHQIWLGPNPIPERERAWCEQTAKLNAGSWKHQLHGNELLEKYGQDTYVRHMVSKGEKIAFLTDRLRVLLLRDHGGVYIDADAEPLKPLDSIPVWDMPHMDFVAGLRSPGRRDVALHRAVPLVDNTFMGSAQQGRMIHRIAALWTPEQVNGQNTMINGASTGKCVIEHASWDTCFLNHRFVYCTQIFPESLLSHDIGNLGSWTTKKP